MKGPQAEVLCGFSINVTVNADHCQAENHLHETNKKQQHTFSLQIKIIDVWHHRHYTRALL